MERPPDRDERLKQLRQLGQQTTDLPRDYSPQLLEAFDNAYPQKDAWTSFVCPEFTSICPKTQQPDFARISINYIAHKRMVESKSLKLYLFSFRNHGAFHEDCIQMICDDLVQLLRPKFTEVIGEFTPRGGIAIYPYANWADQAREYQELKTHRDRNYGPGKYTLQGSMPR